MMKRASLLLALAVASACGGSSNPHGDAGNPLPDLGVDTGLDTGTDAGVDSGVDAGDPCVDPSGCYACTPTSTTQFLNACTAGACAPFDNVARIPGFTP